MSNSLSQLAALKQSIWYDNIERRLLKNGDLARMIAEDCVTGLTSNPAIFNKAIANSSDYDTQLNDLLVAEPEADTVSCYEALAISDIRAAADLMHPVFERTQGADGYVSLEVSPLLANQTEASIAEAHRLYVAVDRPNLMIKIPATAEGIPAIQALIGAAINVNVTLMFSLQHYNDVAEAYLQGLEALDSAGGDVSKVASVASFFISRVDSSFDSALEAIGSEEALALRGKMGIANAKAAYKRFQELFGSERFQKLADKGARVQRPLWASTGTKNPAYSDVLYVEELIGTDTVNTMPPATLEAFKAHGVAESRLTDNVDQALADMEAIAALGIDYNALTEALQSDGVDAFIKPFEELLSAIDEKQVVLKEPA